MYDNKYIYITHKLIKIEKILYAFKNMIDEFNF